MGNSIQTPNATELYPGWKKAVREFFDTGKQFGDMLTHTWLYEAFSIVPPTPSTPHSESAKAQLAFLGQFKRFESELLEEHQIALKAVRGVGYEVLHPRDQTKFGYERGMTEIKRGLKKAVKTLAHTNLSELTADERRENADSMAKMAGLRGMVRTTELQQRITDAMGHTLEDGLTSKGET